MRWYLCLPMIPVLLGTHKFTALHPRGASGKQFQSYGLWMASYADFVGSKQDGQSILRVCSTWGVRRSHNFRENSLSVVASALLKCALKV
jgi:hypothetical protein